MTTPTEPHPWTANTSGAVEKRPKNASLRRERNDEHGATADLALAPRAEQIADGLRELVPAASSSDDPTIRLLSLVLARIERANLYLDERGILDRRGSPRAVLRVLSAWENTAARMLRDLGMTPASRAHLGLELVPPTPLAVATSRNSRRRSRLVAKAEGSNA